MLKTSSLKLLAACVCPVAGTGVMVATVPPVKKAVHRMTAVKEAPPVQTAAREPIQAVPCIPVGGVGISGGIDVPFSSSTSFNGLPGGGSVVPGPVFSPPGRSNPGGPGVTPGAVPEPDAWATMVLGFAIVGYSFRKARKETLKPAQENT